MTRVCKCGIIGEMSDKEMSVVSASESGEKEGVKVFPEVVDIETIKRYGEFMLAETDYVTCRILNKRFEGFIGIILEDKNWKSGVYGTPNYGKPKPGVHVFDKRPQATDEYVFYQYPIYIDPGSTEYKLQYETPERYKPGRQPKPPIITDEYTSISEFKTKKKSSQISIWKRNTPENFNSTSAARDLKALIERLNRKSKSLFDV